MAATAPVAIAIARPLWQALRARPFSGYVASRFERACNLVDDEGRIIALTLPAIGNGPFCIVLGMAAGSFMELEPHQPARVDAERIVLGPWHIPLSAARIWDATLPGSVSRLYLPPAIVAILQPYAGWPQPASDTLVSIHAARLLAQGARMLMSAVERRAGLAEAVQQLAGLGHGLTPAGDDYVLGVMAALWLLGERAVLPGMAQVAAARTTTLSAAFLVAAAQGQFMEAWHELAHALYRQDEPGSRKAVRRIAEFGASSGRDALAGFATTIVNCRQDMFSV